MASKTLSIIVCVFFNERSLPELHREISVVEELLAVRGVSLELIFVNDGSRDNSLQELLKIKSQRPQTKVISHARNFGAVAALKTGFQFVTGDASMLLAADLQDPPEQVLPMMERWLEGDKFVVSVRASRDDPVATRVFSRLYYWILGWMVVPDYPRGGFDLMLMDKVMLPYMRESTKHTNPNLYAFWLGFEPAVLLYHRRARRHGKSRWTLMKKLKFFVDTITGFSMTPIRMLSAFGVIVALLSFLYGFATFVVALAGGVPVRGFAALVVLITFFSGLILIMLGAIGEYLWRVLEAVNNRPEAVIDETFL